MSSMFSFLNKPPFSSFEDQIVSIFKSSPKLPGGFIDGLVQYSPVITLIFGLISLGTASLYLRVIGVYGLIYLTLSILSAFLLLSAFTELKAQHALGWRMVFWSSNVSILASVVRVDVVGLVLGAFISWYFLTQARSKYS